MIDQISKKLRSLRNAFRPAPRHALVGRSDLWQMKRAFQIDYLRRQGLQAHDRLLDIGCGSLRGGAAMISFLDAGCYCGIDVRANVLAEAKEELRREKLLDKRAQLVICPDMSELALGRCFNVMWAFSVFFHLSDPVLEGCMAMVAKHFERESVLFANVIIGDGEPGQWQGFPVASRSLRFYENLASRHGLVAEVLGSLSDLGHDSGDASQDSQQMLRFARIATIDGSLTG